MANDTVPEATSIRVYKYRWLILVTYCAFSVVNFAQYLQYSIISNIISRYYGTSDIETDLSGLMFPIIYVIGFLPCSFFIEKYNLRITAIAAAGLTTIGNLLKLASLSPDRYYVVLIAQAFCALAQILMISIPSKVASVWFGPEEVSTACAVAVLGTQLGVAVGCIVPTSMVGDNESKDDIERDLFIMLIVNAVITTLIFLITCAVFKPRPQLPPSQSQLSLVENEEATPFFKHFKEMVVNKDFLILLLAFGISNGIWSSFGILFNKIYLSYFPNSAQDAGIIALIAIISGGCFGSLIFGYLLDKTHKFRLISFGVLFASAVCYVSVIVVLEVESKLASYFALPLFAFFISSTLVISFEYVLEVTYPVPESASCAVMNAVIFSVSLILTFVFEGLFDAIGILNTELVILVLLFICSASIWFVSTNLRRRNANLAVQQ